MATTQNTKPKGVHLRGNTYHARLVIPQGLRDTFGHREFSQSLNTGDIRIAKVVGEAIIKGWKRQISEARGDVSPISEALAWKQEFDKAELEHNDPDPRNYHYVHDVLDSKLEDIARTDGYDAARTFSDIVHGRVLPSNSFVKKYISTRTVTSRSALQEETRIGYAITAFPTYPISKQDVNKWALSLTQDPVSAQGKPYSHGTAKSIINTNAQYYQFLTDMGHLDPNLNNPFKNVRLSTGGGKKKPTAKKRIPWEVHQIEHIITACTAKGDRDLLDIVLIGAHTGARINELATLLVSSIHLDTAIPYFTITESKTESGLREVPIHPYIITVFKGMLERATNKYLFSNLTVTSDNERSSAISKKFGKLKTKLGYGPSQVFHSFRHTATTQLEQAGVAENVAMDIIGHGKDSQTFGHYSGGTSLEQKYEAIKAGFTYAFHTELLTR